MQTRRYIVLMTVTTMGLFLGVFTATRGHAQAGWHFLLTHHVREVVANGKARFIQALPPTQEMRLAIMLPIRNQAALDSFLQSLHNRQNLSFHHYLTPEEFADEFGPTPEDYLKVVDFAETNGMTVVGTSPNRLVLDVTATVANINSALHLTMGVYQHPTENRTFYAPDREPSVDLDVPLWHVDGLDNYSTPRPLYVKGSAQSNTTGSGPDGNFLGSDRRTAYVGDGYPGGTELTGSGQSIGLVEFYGYALSDVQNYFTNIGQTLNVPINNVYVDGANDSYPDDTEPVIDIVEAASMAPGLSQIRVYIAPISAGSGVGDTAIFNQMAVDDIAKQLSCSWNWAPDDPTTDDPIFEEFEAQGQTLFAASNDYGSYYDNTYLLHYPEEDPYVTAVGGTDLTTGQYGVWEGETAWGGSLNACAANTGSGGGPSPDGIPIPSYQKLSGVINSSNKGSTTLRNVPDVAAEANCDNYYCANGSCGEGLGGTSLAAPTWAGFVALINEQNVADGEGTLGFLNPTMYSVGSGYFHDITVGDNFTSASPSLYSAVTGYDLVTGWGSPTDGAVSLTISPSGIQEVLEGTPVYYTLTVSSPYTQEPINLSVSCLDNTCSVSPASLTGSGTAQVTVIVNKTGTFGVHAITSGYFLALPYEATTGGKVVVKAEL
jgi:subtilase family serine protease